jgi:signal transduction histidine kinase
MLLSIRRTSEEARRIQSALHPSLLDDLGILPTISWHLREFQKSHSGLRVETQIDIEENDIPAFVKIVTYRITQEALNNIAKHSKADLLSFGLCKTDKIELLIRDNGRGFHPSEKPVQNGSGRGIGLSSMKERAELSGGCFEIASAVGKGTTIRVCWPLAGTGTVGDVKRVGASGPA